ncbi:MAG: winged helix DNA-binding protein [Nitrosopumilus sp.]
MKSQDMRILDQQVRLDIIDVRKGSMNAIRAPHVESSLNTLNNNNITNQQFDKSVKSRDVTGTELSILRLLVGEAKSPIDIQKIVSLSREHVSRIMKEIYHKGLVSRETGERPYRYKLTDSGEKLIDISV